MCMPDSPLCFRSQTGSEDSGVRVSIGSDESDFGLKSKVSSNDLVTLLQFNLELLKI